MVGEEWGGELKAALRFLRAVAREHSCAVVVVVHLVKPPRERKRGKDAPIHGQDLVDVMGQWTRQADSVALISDAGGGRLLWRMTKRVPASTLVLAAEAGTFHALELVAGEDLGADTRHRVLSCIASGQADAGGIATYLAMSVRTVRRHVAALREAGLVTPDGPYSVSPSDTLTATTPASTIAASVSPLVTPQIVVAGDTGGDMSPPSKEGGGDGVTLSSLFGTSTTSGIPTPGEDSQGSGASVSVDREGGAPMDGRG